jgi:hypothetical protein
MAFKTLKFVVTGGPTSTAATTQIALGTFDTSALGGGYGAIASPTQIFIRSKIMVDEVNGDHDSVTWEKLAVFTLNSSTGGATLQQTGSTANGNGASNGQIGSVNTSVIAYDVSGASVIRCLVTPENNHNFVWWAYHDIQVVQFS